MHSGLCYLGFAKAVKNYHRCAAATGARCRKGVRYLKEIQVKVIDNDLEKAMRVLKKKIQNDGLFKRLKLKKSYEKPSEYRRRKQREALRRRRIAAAKARYKYRYGR